MFSHVLGRPCALAHAPRLFRAHQPNTTNFALASRALQKLSTVTRTASGVTTTAGTIVSFPFRYTKGFIVGTLLGSTVGLLIAGPSGVITGGKLGQTVGTGTVCIQSIVTIGGVVGGGVVGGSETVQEGIKQSIMGGVQRARSMEVRARSFRGRSKRASREKRCCN